MKGPYWIETLARNGEVLNRHQVPALPIRLGRGYDNDVILDDAHTAARHAVIEADADGRPVLRDLGSRNGSIHRGRRHASVALDGDTVVRLGHTNLRLRGADHPVSAELADTTMHDWEGLTPALLGLGLTGAITVLSTWLSDTRPFELAAYLLVLSYALAGALVWGALWAFGNRLFGHHARLGRHLFIFGCGLVAMEATATLSSVAAYSYSMEWLTRYGSHALIAIFCCIVFFHLCTIKPHHPRRMAAISLVLLLLGSSLALIRNLQENGHMADDLYMAVLLPPAFRLSGDHTPDEFFRRAGALKAGVDAERGKAAPGADPDDGEE